MSQNYNTGYAINTNEMFTRFPCSYIKKNYSNVTKSKYAASVWTYCFKLVLEDIIENSITFMLPTRQEAFLEMRRFSGDEFIKARQNGAFQEVDFLKSNFSANKLQFRYRSKHNTHYKPIHVHATLRDKITEYTNNGKQYY